MKTLYYLEDREYPERGTKHTRVIARAILKNKDGLFALHKIERDDEFGKYTYYETPGGGVDKGESVEEGLIRECLEETGYKVEILEEIGIVDDYYSYISRHNLNHYFLAKIIEGDGKMTIASEGDSFIAETLYLPIEEVIKLYEQMEDHMLPGLVKRRELPIWQLVAKKLG